MAIDLTESINILSPVITQDVSAVEALAAFLNKPIDSGVLDLGNVKMVQSNKKDVFYTVTAKECSCPSFQYRGGPCKHIRKHFAEDKLRGQTIGEVLAEADKNLHKMPKSYQRMVRAAREEAESEEEPIPEEQCYKAVCKPVDEKERAIRLAEAKEKIEASKQQARDLKERQKIAREEAESEGSLIVRGGFKPCLPEEEPLSDFDRVS